MKPKNANDIIEQALLHRGVEPKLAGALAKPKTEADRVMSQIVLGNFYLGAPIKKARKKGATK